MLLSVYTVLWGAERTSYRKRPIFFFFSLISLMIPSQVAKMTTGFCSACCLAILLLLGVLLKEVCGFEGLFTGTVEKNLVLDH